MSWSVTVETVDGEAKVTNVSGSVPSKVTVSGHVNDGSPGSSPPYLVVNDGVLNASVSQVTA